MKPEVLDQKPITMATLKHELDLIKKRDKELGIISNKTDTTFTNTREPAAGDINMTIITVDENTVTAQVLKKAVFHSTMFCCLEKYCSLT